MNDKDLKLDILEEADNAEWERLAKSYPPAVGSKDKDRMFRESRKKYLERTKESTNINHEHEIEVSGVEVRTDHWWRRAAAMAAAFVLTAAAVTGGALLVRSALRGGGVPAMTELPSDTEASEPEVSEPEPDTEAPTDEIPASVIDYDMSTKEGICNKILNRIDYYDKVAGQVIDNSSFDAAMCRITDFESNIPESRSYIYKADYVLGGTEADIIANNCAEIIEKSPKGPYEFYCDGQYQWMINEAEKTYTSGSSEGNIEAFHRDDIQVSFEKFREYFIDRNKMESDELNEKYKDGYPHFLRPYAENLIHGASRIEPVQIILDYLINFDIWKISGEETYIGRKCVVITGHYTNIEVWNYNDYLIGGTFTLYIDKETGWLLKALDYAPDGNLENWMITTSISFDDEAADVRYIDLSGYEEVKFY